MQPKLKITGNEIDYELAELLGKKPNDFLVLCFNGVPFEGFGTPHDTITNRKTFDSHVAHLSDDMSNVFSIWRDFFDHWKANLIQQYGLAADATADDFQPTITWEIHRVVAGFSKHVHAAMRLLHDVGTKAKAWEVIKTSEGKFRCIITGQDDRVAAREGDDLALTVARAIRDHLTGATCMQPETREQALERLLRRMLGSWQDHCSMGILADEEVYLEAGNGQKQSDYAEALELVGMKPLA